MRKSKEDCPAQERPDCEYCLDTGRYVNDFSGTVGQPCAYCLKGEGECRAGSCYDNHLDGMDRPTRDVGLSGSEPMTQHNTRAQLIAAASEIRSVHGENPEYDRALCELIANVYGVPEQDTATTADQIAEEIGIGSTDADAEMDGAEG